MIVVGRMIVGLGMLTLGRQLFWLFVGGLGFVFGLNLAGQVIVDQPETTTLLFALFLGLIGAVIALVLQRLAVSLAGFIGGGIITVQLLAAFSIDIGSTLVTFVLGGIVGLILVSFLFDWALILLSSAAGAQTIVGTVGWERPLSLIMVVVVTAVGIVIQASHMQREGKSG